LERLRRSRVAAAPAFLDFYADVDKAIGELVDAMPDGTPLFVLADHGHTLIDGVLSERPAAERGSEFKTPTPKSVADLDPSSKASSSTPAAST
jgi:arylsulfatase A-like enzyme